MPEDTDRWVRYDIPGSERPWFYHPTPCPLDHMADPHLHSRNEDGSWGVSVVPFDPGEVVHRSDCYEIEPGKWCNCPTLAQLGEVS